ncbi:hypothetical protein N431DRAFT_487294 [Stipitochalara longipes BDJ]|nr:hypothetical protein N431DRAFT_487294 [Stipitochalara longipes BDJ]
MSFFRPSQKLLPRPRAKTAQYLVPVGAPHVHHRRSIHARSHPQAEGEAARFAPQVPRLHQSPPPARLSQYPYQQSSKTSQQLFATQPAGKANPILLLQSQILNAMTGWFCSSSS